MIKKLLLGVVAFAMTASAWAQKPDYLSSGLLDGKTIVKANVTGLAFGTYGVYAERMLSKRISLQLGYSTMPTRSLSTLSKLGSDARIFETATLGYQMFTPEVRIYLGNGYGRSFYVSPYYRYERYTYGGLSFVQDPESSDLIKNLGFSGETTSHGVGLAIGAQWLMGKKKNIVLDWTIYGMHRGWAKTNMNASVDLNKSDRFSDQDMKELEKDINDGLDQISAFGNITGNVTFESDAKGAHTVKSVIDHPFIFFRANLSLGFRF